MKPFFSKSSWSSSSLRLVVAVAVLLITAVPSVSAAKHKRSKSDNKQQPKQLEIDVFQATLLMSVSDDIVSATTTQSTLFQDNFLGTYNQLQDQDDDDDDDDTPIIICDPFGRNLNSVFGYNPAFNPNSGAEAATRNRKQRQLRNLQAHNSIIMIPLDQEHDHGEEGDSLSFTIPESLQRHLQAFSSPIRRNQTRVLLQVSGTCTNCKSDMTIFFNDVRRRNLQEAGIDNNCPPGAELRTPTAEDTVVAFNDNNNASGLTYETTGISQLFPQDCPAPLNSFGLDTYSFTLDVSPLSVPALAFHDVMRYLTTDDNLSKLYNDFVTQGYCDPLYRYMDQVEYVSNNIFRGTTITYRIGGVCRGCVSLFGTETLLPPSVGTLSTVPSLQAVDPSVRRERRLQVQQQEQRSSSSSLHTHTASSSSSRLLQEDQCWCSASAFQGPATQAEFEEYLTQKFLELASAFTLP